VTSSDGALSALGLDSIPSVPAPAPAKLALPPASGGEATNADAELDEPRLSSVAAIQKRIKAHTKKIQRIAGYEGQSEGLNKDQQAAVASKPGLEAAVKDLTEFQKVLEVRPLTAIA